MMEYLHEVLPKVKPIKTHRNHIFFFRNNLPFTRLNHQLLLILTAPKTQKRVITI